MEAPEFVPGTTCCSQFTPDKPAHFICDDLAELEWLSNFVDESFSSDDLQKHQLISGIKLRPDESSETGGFQSTCRCPPRPEANGLVLRHAIGPPASLFSARQLHLQSLTSSYRCNHPPPNHPGKKPVKTISSKKKEGGVANSDGRKCLHCATDKTPQWRTGPMGPQTLCNACGVRYKSGRLVPEYRPAASPTFVLTKHSNSHRKHHHQNMVFDVSNGDDY
ncbi:hypothetical protein V6Z11_A05G049300 [Gossypium hirsutum]